MEAHEHTASTSSAITHWSSCVSWKEGILKVSHLDHIVPVNDDMVSSRRFGFFHNNELGMETCLHLDHQLNLQRDQCSTANRILEHWWRIIRRLLTTANKLAMTDYSSMTSTDQ
jgi:hypothetical protein